MQIHWTRADGASAGKRNSGKAGTRQRWAQRKNGSAHGLDEFVWRDGIADGVRLKSVVCRGEFAGRYGDAHIGEQLTHGNNVSHLRHVGPPNAVSRPHGCVLSRQPAILSTP